MNLKRNNSQKNKLKLILLILKNMNSLLAITA